MNKKIKYWLCIFGLAGIACVTMKAAAAFTELSSIELKDQSYNGKIYEYAIQKEYETSDPGQEVTFDEKHGGYKLSDVQYKTLKTVLQKKEVTEARIYKDLLEKDENKIAQTIAKDGTEYQLKDIEWSQVDNIEDVSYTQDYGYCTAEPEAPAVHEYTYTSPVTKKENTVTLPLARMETGDTAWVDGFSATVTFHNLDGTYFKLGKHEFKYNPESLTLSDYDFTELVRMLGYDTSKYRLNSVSWSGKPYKSGGETCRDAAATGQQYAASYKAVYEDKVKNGKIYTANATYAAEVEVPAEEAAPTYVMQAIAYYEKGNLSIMVSMGIMIVLVLVIAILYVLSQNRKKSESSGDFTTSHGVN